MKKPAPIDEFDFSEGRILAARYQVLEKVGQGWEGEVYKVSELDTGVIRAAKLFYPHRNPKYKVSNKYAIKLDKMVECSLVMNYYHQVFLWHRGHKVACIISEFIEGEKFSEYLNKLPKKKMNYLSALQFLHALISGLEEMHRIGQYHGDLHTENIMIRPYGISFHLKLLDMYDWKDTKKENKAHDIVSSIRVFYDALGGKKHYSKCPKEIKEIVLGLRRDLIVKKFKTASHLKQHLENIQWDESYRV